MTRILKESATDLLTELEERAGIDIRSPLRSGSFFHLLAENVGDRI
ncbi:hypothetical protein CA13_62610 [Planctomycetes bacterium CA13]|uniref:Uncharacterized protein n=1 Tax=Novipirellula herctigrandis TaxID=2527986 RepID=A0A5C5ZD83_9BACT|nr:hypothetical protein CA13_62610 [Planctomycetes bacterium CA13]